MPSVSYIRSRRSISGYESMNMMVIPQGWETRPWLFMLIPKGQIKNVERGDVLEQIKQYVRTNTLALTYCL